RTRVPPASTTSPLPSLPLPSDAKRTPASALLQLVLEKRQDLLAGRGLVGRAVRILDRHDAARVGLRDADLVLLGLFALVLPEHELREQSLVARRRLRIGITDEVLALRAVAIDDGETDAVEREPDAGPRAVEAVVEHELIDAVGCLLKLGTLLRRAAGACRLHGRNRLRFRHPEADHQPAEPFGVLAGIW